MSCQMQNGTPLPPPLRVSLAAFRIPSSLPSLSTSTLELLKCPPKPPDMVVSPISDAYRQSSLSALRLAVVVVALLRTQRVGSAAPEILGAYDWQRHGEGLFFQF